MLSNAVLAVLSVVSISAYRILAADCYGDVGVHPDLVWIESMAEVLCGTDNECSAQGDPTECTLTMPISNGAAAIGFKSSSSQDFSSCTSATQNIIDLCFNTQSVTYSQSTGETYGNWSYGGQYYLLTIDISPDHGFSTEPEEEILAWDPEDILMDGSGDTDQYVYGPTQWCQGLSPGGESCMQIDAGCYIVVPQDNVIPEQICD
ncbi:hypothetical protein BU16DRAFT_621392 [Lophium mytilinum]|uniref:Uncharacterized protein n=1 Tax=Lophium mytilinum TaxID=390894 RepID=A0A6A6QHK9_9PEZI|nr:hypothetical protein BU16DRAFT_621392 [Lophium mytilinum]